MTNHGIDRAATNALISWLLARRAPTATPLDDGSFAVVTLSELATAHLDSEPAEAARAVFAPRLPRAA